jgi:hypothetical protein
MCCRSGARGHAEDRNDEYRLTVDPSYALTDYHKWMGVGHLGYFKSDDNNYQTAQLGLGAIWKFAPWGEAWFGVNYYRTDNEISADVEEWRPHVGLKNYFTRSAPFTFYNLVRLEYRMRQFDGDEGDTESFRLRDRLGIVFALTKEQERPGSWYAIADAEAFYRFDGDTMDRVRLRTGLGVSLSDRVRVELVYYAQFTDVESGGFEWTDNIYRFNIKLARQKGLLSRLMHSDSDGDD